MGMSIPKFEKEFRKEYRNVKIKSITVEPKRKVRWGKMLRIEFIEPKK